MSEMKEVEREHGLDNNSHVMAALKVVSEVCLTSYRSARDAALKLWPALARVDESQRALQREIAEAVERAHGLDSQVALWRRSPMPVPVELEREGHEVERTLHDLRARFEKGRNRLEAAGRRIEDARAVAREVLVNGIKAECSALGSKVRELIPEDDFIATHPHRVDPEAIRLQNRASELAVIADALSGKLGSAYQAFSSVAGPTACSVFESLGGYGAGHQKRVAI